MSRKTENDFNNENYSRNIWGDLFENDIVLTVPQAESLLKETGAIFSAEAFRIMFEKSLSF